MRILLVGSDERMAAAIRRGLSAEGVRTEVATSAGEALEMSRSTAFDGLVVDVTLPDFDGFQTCRRLREGGVWAPIIMLTARDKSDDGIRGLDEGADDYLVRPFALGELIARLRAVARRAPVERPTVLCVGDLRLDPAARRVWRSDVEIALSVREFALLETLMRRPGHALSKAQLLESVWDAADGASSNVVEVYVRYLREKVDRPFGVQSIETVRGIGYRLRADEPADATESS